MKWFPQTGAGSLVQLPLHRRRKWRAIANDLENGERISLPDAAAGQIEWRLSYRDLSDAEVSKLNDLFAACRGRFGSFGFVDPIANLLTWSEDLSHADWQTGLLSKASGATDPMGTRRAWTVSNGSPGSQALSQTVSVPGDYVACFSLWVRSNTPGSVILQRDAVQSSAAVGPVWKQAFAGGAGASGAANSTVSLTLAAGHSVDVWGLQFEVQPYASQYKPTAGASRIYEETYFGTDELIMTSTGVGLSACELTLVSRV
ncbi:MAG: hypothetical protein ABUS51_04215 [Acidobacteriota bacterium]